MKQYIALFLALLTMSCVTFNVPSDFLASSQPTSSSSSAPTQHKVGATIVPQQAGDFWVNPTATSPFQVKDGSGVVRDSFSTTHGAFTAGGGGSDFKSQLTPIPANETTDVGLYLLVNAGTANNANFAVEYGALCDALAVHSHATCFNAGGASSTYGDILFTNANGTASTQEMLGYFDGSSGILNTKFGLSTGSAGGAVAISSSTSAPTIQSGTGASSLTLGTNKTSATLTLQSGAASTTLLTEDGSNNLYLGATSVGTQSVNNTYIWALGGWELEWLSGGQLLSASGNIDFGTINGNAFTTTLTAGNNISVIVLGAPSGAGTGTTAINGSLAITTRTVSTSPFTIDTTTTDHAIIIDTTSSVITVTLPTPTNGRELTLIDSGHNWATHNVTLARHASEKIDTVAGSKTLSDTCSSSTKYVVHILSNGTDWWTDCSIAGTRGVIPLGGDFIGCALTLVLVLAKRRAMNFKKAA